MKIKLLLTISTCLLFICPKLFAQDNADTTKKGSDYIININNDTIKCEIDNKFFDAKPKYKNLAGRYVKILKDSIKQYYLSKDSSVVMSKFLPGSPKPVFVERIEAGKINLYEMTRGGGSTSIYQIPNPVNGFTNSGNSFTYTYWFASKGNDSLKLIKFNGAGSNFSKDSSRKKREKALMDMFADDQNALNNFKDALKNEEYTFELIRTYIKAYNFGHSENPGPSK